MEQFYIKWRWCSRYYNSVKGLKKGINQLTIVTPIHDQYWSEEEADLLSTIDNDDEFEMDDLLLNQTHPA
ncbi:4617_t:CDS:2 [Entrophospora sp. SA101]|nr:4617_t:CDS:2 [Entrophospora sp. SA101]